MTGRAAVFCRFTGCNLWSGREEDRSEAICQFCDTDFWGMDGALGGRYTATELAQLARSQFPEQGKPYIVCTGGEPLLQLDAELVAAFHAEGFEVAIETNGTLPVPAGVDWVCVSPKAGTEIVVRQGDELKLVCPQVGIHPYDFQDWDFKHFYAQPMDGLHLAEATRWCLNFCRQNPQWKLSIQTHKLIDIP